MALSPLKYVISTLVLHLLYINNEPQQSQEVHFLGQGFGQLDYRRNGILEF
jgi:hypothetical protein